MNVCEDACWASEEEALAGLAGVEFQHDLFVVVGHRSAWTTISGFLARSGAEVQALQISPCATGFYVRCRLSRIDALLLPPSSFSRQ